MGDPKYPRRVWKKPKRPLNYDLKMEELQTLGKFGLKTKRELWKARTELSRVRHQARSLLALGREVRKEKEPILLRSLSRTGLVGAESTLDDILSLQVTDLLARRLQTVVMKKFGFRTPYQARQAVVHGHVMIGERRVDIPSYVVTLEEEPQISLRPGSGFQKAVRDRSDADRKDGAEAVPDRDGAEAAPKGAEAVLDKDGAEAAPKDGAEAAPKADSKDAAPGGASEGAETAEGR